jgi:hypothetical protein
MEPENQNLIPKKPSSSTEIAEFEAIKPVLEQREQSGTIAATLVLKWIELERIILKAPEIGGRIESDEEIRLMEKMILRYATFTPKEIGDAMRRAAEDRQRDYAQNGGYPKMYMADIEHELQKMGIERLKQKPETPQLAANTGGNAFWGDPSEALKREWPKIVRQTRVVRAINPKLRDRFWYGGSPEQRDSAVKMLRQMVIEMNDAGKWDLRQNQWETLAIFNSEFSSAFPAHLDLLDGLSCPIDPIQVDDRRKTLIRRSMNVDAFPDIDDCKYCAVFDAYWKFTKADEMAVE